LKGATASLKNCWRIF